MDTLELNGVTYWLPASQDDVIALVNSAHAANEVICVRGAAHSFPIIGVLEKGPTSGKPYRYVMLSLLDDVFIDGTRVTVAAGCHLGPDPFDPTGRSTLQNSLVYQLDQQGLSLPDLGGITHQTVGGFLATGSSGGSTKYAFEDGLTSVTVVACAAGTGAALHTFAKPATPNPDDPFYAVGMASMGLLGILVSATFECQPRFFLEGQEATTTVAACAIDLFGPGQPARPSLEQFLQATDYSRLMWWPQASVQKLVVWQATRTDEAGADAWASAAYAKMSDPPSPLPALKPYQEVPYLLNSPIPATLAADLMFSAFGTWPTWLLNMLGDTAEYRAVTAAVNAAFYPSILPKLLDLFVPTDTPDNPNKGPQLFADVWYTGLPMDNQMSDRLMPVWFTELWIDIAQTAAVMTALRDFYQSDPAHAGSFSCEIYAAKNNPFWLSPAFGLDVIRIDVFWFANNTADPVAFYQQFWELLAPYRFRPHWAKFLPAGDGSQGVPYLRSLYPQWDAWMQLRAQLDPDQVFVNDYWRQHMGIAAPLAAPANQALAQA